MEILKKPSMCVVRCPDPYGRWKTWKKNGKKAKKKELKTKNGKKKNGKHALNTSFFFLLFEPLVCSDLIKLCVDAAKVDL
jgi:hypothetical protein